MAFRDRSMVPHRSALAKNEWKTTRFSNTISRSDDLPVLQEKLIAHGGEWVTAWIDGGTERLNSSETCLETIILFRKHALNYDHPTLKMIREFVALGRAQFDRPATPTGVADAQTQIVRGMTIVDEDGNTVPIDGGLAALLAPRAPFFDNGVLEALANRVTQIVNIGAGYDDRSIRFRQPGVTYFEVDFPEIITDKRSRIALLESNENALKYVPIDLQQGSIEEALRTAGHDDSKPTLFICEHVMLFLDEVANRKLLTETSRIAAPGSAILLTAETHPSGMPTDAVVTEVDRVMFGSSQVMRFVRSFEGWRTVLSECGWLVDESRGFAMDHFFVPDSMPGLQIQTAFMAAALAHESA